MKNCDNVSAIRDIADERKTLWRLDSWQAEQVVPAGVVYSSGGMKPGVVYEPDSSVVFQYTLSGLVRFGFHGEERVASAGQAYIFPSSAEPRWKTAEDPEYRCFWMRLFGAGLHEHWQLLRDVHGPAIALEPDGQVMRACREIVTLRDQAVDLAAEAIAIHAFVMALYQHCERGQAERMQPVQRAIQHILRYPFYSTSLKQIAHEHEVSREHLARVFFQEVGQAPATWLREQRYQRAVGLLRVTKIPINEIVSQVGFGSVDALARLLQDREGMSPTAYRELYG